MPPRCRSFCDVQRLDFEVLRIYVIGPEDDHADRFTVRFGNQYGPALAYQIPG